MFPRQTRFYTPLTPPPPRATRPAHLIILHLMTPIISVSSTSHKLILPYYLQHRVTSQPFVPYCRKPPATVLPSTLETKFHTHTKRRLKL
jgi:hypothetical protein